MGGEAVGAEFVRYRKRDKILRMASPVAKSTVTMEIAVFSHIKL
jgi:hypothetical protein